MLTMTHPREVRALLDFPTGLLLARLSARDRPVLLVKAPKEVALTAKLRQGFRVYAVPVEWKRAQTAILVTAFFDNPDEPLVLFSPLLAEDGARDLVAGLLGEKLDVHFFDELNHELLGYRASVSVPDATRDSLSTVTLFPFDEGLVKTSVQQAMSFMSVREANDDAQALAVNFQQAIFPEDLFFIDARPATATHHGAPGYHHRKLERTEPGPLQELDIIGLLARTFAPSQIFHGPLRVTDNEEIADVVVLGDKYILLVQAKDSPNTEEVLNNTLDRKKATALKSLRKASAQAKGAVRYLRSRETFDMLVEGKLHQVAIDGRTPFSLIVVKELFNDEFAAYSEQLIALATASGAPCVALDYPELNQYTSHLRGEPALFNAFERVFRIGTTQGAFPRLRFTLT